MTDGPRTKYFTFEIKDCTIINRNTFTHVTSLKGGSMSITELPHNGSNIKIDLSGEHTIFDYSATDYTAYRPDNDPINDSPRLLPAILALTTAHRADNDHLEDLVLGVSPEMGALLRVQGFYGLAEVLRYTHPLGQTLTSKLQDYIRIPPTPHNIFDYHVKVVEISPRYKNMIVYLEGGR